MDPFDWSRKDSEAVAGGLPLHVEERDRRRLWVRTNVSLTSCLVFLVLVLNSVIIVEYTVPWVNSVLLATENQGAPTIGFPTDHAVSHAGPRDMQWPVQAYKTEAFLAPDMLVSKTGRTDEGYLFLTPWGNGTNSTGPSIMTESNELIWHGPTGDTTNVRLQDLNGKSVLTYWNGTSTATFGHSYGAITVLDDTYSTIAKVCMKDIDIKTPGNAKFACYLDMHESYITDRGTVIATAYNVTKYDLSSARGPKKGWIFDSLFFEIDIATEKVLFRWSSLEHVKDIPISDSHHPFTLWDEEFGRTEKSPWDYFHINSVQPVDGGGYLVNARHTFAMYKVSKDGDVEWQLQGIHGGDFSLAPGIRFSWQHEPRILSIDGSKIRLTLYNNDNSEASDIHYETTALDLTLDLDAKTASLNRKLVDPADPIYSASQGSFEILPGSGHSLVGHGQIAKVKEYDADDNVVYTAEFGASTDRLLVASYRAYRYVWRATPAYAPKIVAESSGDLTHVYVSWNGATDVHYWAVYAGDSKGAMTPVAKVHKSGFETQISLAGPIKYVQAEALGTDGEHGAVSLRMSAVQRVKPVQGSV